MAPICALLSSYFRSHSSEESADARIGGLAVKRRRHAITLAVISLLLCGFLQAPPAPLVLPFGDSVDWVTTEDMAYTIGTTTEKIIVPKGFVTDFASIPQPLWSFGLSPHGQYSRAAVIHDYLYWAQGCTRIQSDRLLLIAM